MHSHVPAQGGDSHYTPQLRHPRAIYPRAIHPDSPAPAGAQSCSGHWTGGGDGVGPRAPGGRGMGDREPIQGGRRQ